MSKNIFWLTVVLLEILKILEIKEMKNGSKFCFYGENEFLVKTYMAAENAEKVEIM